MSCSGCGERAPRPLFCGGCANQLVLRQRMNVLRVQGQVGALAASIESAYAPGASLLRPGALRTGSAETRLCELQAQRLRTQRALEQCRAETEQIKQEIESARATRQANAKNILVSTHAGDPQERSGVDASLPAEPLPEYMRDAADSAAKSRAESSIVGATQELEKRYLANFHMSTQQQSRCCKSLLALFALKKKRRKNEFSVVLGFNTLPEALSLAHYSHALINAGLERVCFFIALLASYLGIQLPFIMALPTKGCPFTRIGPQGSILHLNHGVKTLLRSRPSEFYAYCRVLAMLAINVSHVACRLGIPHVDLGVTAQMSHVVAQIYLRVDTLLRAGHHVQVQTAAVEVSLEALQDYYIDAINLDVNGESAEWSIIEATDALAI